MNTDTIVRKITNIIDECNSKFANILHFNNMKLLSDFDIKCINDYLSELEIIIQNIMIKFNYKRHTGLYDKFGNAIHDGDILISDNYDGELEVILGKPYEQIKFYDRIEGHNCYWYLNQTEIFTPNEIDFLDCLWRK